MDDQTTLIRLEDLRLLCLAARRALYHSTDLLNEANGRWLTEEFENYTGTSKENMLTILSGFDDILDDYREREFQKMLRLKEMNNQ
ncbi:hypothetical protein [Deinococcus ruber]|uniref:Uncharacterized protein n=1 Tax=Deinococcus ruber TaxID=1848197 RepID=A0A918C585_9DEIO|nr:hypothetical protein [Deinococcus ruber]GGR07336.1 hypothetical protein GCM10008957_20010 [Deinococcus ruber]